MPKPKGFPTYAIVEDSPDRLVLQTRGSIYFPAFILFVFAAFWAAPYIAGHEHGVLLFLSGAFLAGALVFLLRWRRFVFDGPSRNVRFTSLLFGSWNVDFRAIERIETDSVERQTTEQRGSTTRTRYYTVYRAFLIVNGKKIHLNENRNSAFIGDICARIERLRGGL